MPSANFKIDPALQPLWNKVKDKKRLYGALLSVGMNAIEKNFETEGARTGKKWDDLKPATKKRRTKKGHWPGQILQDSGHAAGSIQANATEDEAAWGTNVKYLKTHVLGLTINYPAREHVMNFRKITRGKGKGGQRFTTEKKAKFAQKVLNGAHSITFPVRNPFEFTQEDYDDMSAIIKKILSE